MNSSSWLKNIFFGGSFGTDIYQNFERRTCYESDQYILDSSRNKKQQIDIGSHYDE
jgi:hypothetical protein